MAAYFKRVCSRCSVRQSEGGCREGLITPPEFMFPTGVEHKNFIGVHDSVFVRSIVIDNGITRAALVSLEMGNPPEKEEFYEAITRELNIRAEHLFISATHSHNTLSIDQYPGKNAAIYYDLVINATIKSLKEATARLQPARVGYETGKAYVNTNRDQKIGEGYHMGYNPDGPWTRPLRWSPSHHCQETP